MPRGLGARPAGESPKSRPLPSQGHACAWTCFMPGAGRELPDF